MSKLDTLYVIVCAAAQDAANAQQFLKAQGLTDANISVDQVNAIVFNAKDYNAGGTTTQTYTNKYVVQGRIPPQGG